MVQDIDGYLSIFGPQIQNNLYEQDLPQWIYRGGLGMVAISVMIGTRYACYIDYQGD